jgi:DNA repair protein RadC
MKKDVDFTKMYKAAEVKLTYVTKNPTSHRIPIRSAEDAACLFFMVWDITTIEHIEEVKMILLNRANQVLGVVHLSKGGLSGSIIDIRIILQHAIKANASSIILAHNLDLLIAIMDIFEESKDSYGSIRMTRECSSLMNCRNLKELYWR